MKNHWQVTKFLPLQKILNPKQLNWLSFNYHKLMSRILDKYEVNEPKVKFDNYLAKTNELKTKIEEITGLIPNNTQVFNLEESFGNYLKDADGNDILDLNMNNGFHSLGYNHRNYVKLTKLEKFQRYSIQQFTNTPSSDYAKEALKYLHKLAPPGCEEVLLAKSENQALENAVRLSCLGLIEKYPHQKNKSFKVLTFEGNNYQENSIQLPFPSLEYSSQSDHDILIRNTEAEQESLKLITQVVEEIYVDNEIKNSEYVVPCIIIEPIQFKAGVQYASSDYYKKLIKICQTAGIKVVIDETYTCGWATGRMFAYYQWCLEATPDMVVFGGRMFLNGLFYNRNIISSPSELEKNGILFNLNANPDMLNYLRLKELRKMVYDSDWLDLHCSNYIASVKTEFNEIISKAHFKIQNVRGKGKILAFDVEHRLLRDELLNIASMKGIKLNSLGDRTIAMTPSLLFTEVHFTTVKEFLISVVPSTQYISRI